jgi:hypothetical protein
MKYGHMPPTLQVCSQAQMVRMEGKEGETKKHSVQKKWQPAA